jgi:hypothetical protein
MPNVLGKWGCEWFQLQCDNQTEHLHIAAKELIPIIVAAVIWGHHWAGTRVTARCDNMAAVSVLNSRGSRDPQLMQMLRCFFFYRGLPPVTHMPGAHDQADDLSRNNPASFQLKSSASNHHPSLFLIASRMELFSSFVYKE